MAELGKDYAPQDQFFAQQCYLNNTGQWDFTPDVDIDALEAWDITTGDTSVTIAIIDDGFQWYEWAHHPDANLDHFVAGYDFAGEHYQAGANDDVYPSYRETHGDCVTGICCAPHNSIGIAGIAPNVNFAMAKIFCTEGCGIVMREEGSRIAYAFDWCRSDVQADVITCSWWYGNLEDDITDAITLAVASGIPVFFSAGNYGLPRPNYPASLGCVMTVGAIDPWGYKTSYSNYNKTEPLNLGQEILFMVAPSSNMEYGGNFLTTDGIGESGYCPRMMTCNPSGGYDYACGFGGTSAACPQVAATAALVLSVRHDLQRQNLAGAREIYDILISSALDQVGGQYDTEGFDSLYGWGRLNARAALDTAEARRPPECDNCGDADGNGFVNMSDVIYLQNYIFGGGPAPSPYCRGDADGNCIVNVSDAIYIVAYLFGGGGPPHCSEDPSCY